MRFVDVLEETHGEDVMNVLGHGLFALFAPPPTPIQNPSPLHSPTVAIDTGQAALPLGVVGAELALAKPLYSLCRERGWGLSRSVALPEAGLCPLSFHARSVALPLAWLSPVSLHAFAHFLQHFRPSFVDTFRYISIIPQHQGVLL